MIEFNMKFSITALCALLILPSIAHGGEIPPELPITAQSIYWSDADSGRIAGIKFRLANVDAPETGSMKQRGGAKCEEERALGYAAKEYMISATKNRPLKIVRHFGYDKYDRLVVELLVEDNDVAKMGVDAGILAAWPHIKGKAQSKKPNWCQ